MKWAVIILLLSFAGSALIVAPFIQFNEAENARSNATNQLATASKESSKIKDYNSQPTNLVKRVEGALSEFQKIFVDSQTNKQPDIAMLKGIISAPPARFASNQQIDVSSARIVLKDARTKEAANELISRIAGVPLDDSTLRNCAPIVDFYVGNFTNELRKIAVEHGDRIFSTYENAVGLLLVKDQLATIRMESNASWTFNIVFRKQAGFGNFNWEIWNGPFDLLCSFSGENYIYRLTGAGAPSDISGHGRIEAIDKTTFGAALSMLIAIQEERYPIK